jgi:hypothetical protein
MKSGCPASFIEDILPSNRLTSDSADVIAMSIARLMEENEALRRLAALLTSQLDVARELGRQSPQ